MRHLVLGFVGAHGGVDSLFTDPLAVRQRRPYRVRVGPHRAHRHAAFGHARQELGPQSLLHPRRQQERLRDILPRPSEWTRPHSSEP